MIDFHYWPTPNGWKVSILLEELGVPLPADHGEHRQGRAVHPRIHGHQSQPPHAGDRRSRRRRRSGAGVRVRRHHALPRGKSTAGSCLPGSLARKEMLEWLFWQVGNLGPMAGQYSHFVNYAPEGQDYSHRRYRNEYHRCLGVLERRLERREYVLGDDYTIADMICWPWVLIAKAMGQPLTSSRA